mmetsp:Transcript_1477/g.2048  ORF Transcript_1477/g.2048 Transcript_1477/m.2048 type:complete len:119 (-) Transcript_1477:315-671(-)
MISRALHRPLIESLLYQKLNRYQIQTPTSISMHRLFLPKHDYAEAFDHVHLLVAQKNAIILCKGQRKKDKDGNIDYSAIVRENGGPGPKFLEKHYVTIVSLPQNWSKAFLPIYDGSCS